MPPRGHREQGPTWREFEDLKRDVGKIEEIAHSTARDLAVQRAYVGLWGAVLGLCGGALASALVMWLAKR